MRINPEPFLKTTEHSSEITITVSFTSNAINYLPATVMPIDLKEWIWHEEIVDGKMYCIITDKILPADNFPNH